MSAACEDSVDVMPQDLAAMQHQALALQPAVLYQALALQLGALVLQVGA